jgi:hypothetical protein
MEIGGSVTDKPPPENTTATTALTEPEIKKWEALVYSTDDKQMLAVIPEPTDAENRESAENCTNSLMAAAMALVKLRNPLRQPDIRYVMSILKEQADQIAQSGLHGFEMMLILNLPVLQMVFTKNVEKSAWGSSPEKCQIYGNLALKAQNTCRMTIETIMNLKCPDRRALIGNMTISQQVNLNSQCPGAGALPRKTAKRIIKRGSRCGNGRRKNASDRRS